MPSLDTKGEFMVSFTINSCLHNFQQLTCTGLQQGGSNLEEMLVHTLFIHLLQTNTLKMTLVCLQGPYPCWGMTFLSLVRGLNQQFSIKTTLTHVILVPNKSLQSSPHLIIDLRAISTLECSFNGEFFCSIQMNLYQTSDASNCENLSQVQLQEGNLTFLLSQH